MDLPIPETNQTSQAKPSRFLVTLAIAFWALILSGVFAGLIYSVGSVNAKNKASDETRQDAFEQMIPVLELVDRTHVSNREETLLQALEIIEKQVLKTDPNLPLAIQTKDEIQNELAAMKSSTISFQEKRISDQVKNIEQARRQIDQLEDQIARLESANRKLNSEKRKIQQNAANANSSANKKINAKDKEISQLKKQIKQMADQQKRQLAANNNFKSSKGKN